MTGETGLIGSHIVDLLIENGHEVLILDNLAKPTHLQGKPAWINPKTEFLFGDVRERADLDRDSILKFGIHELHLASLIIMWVFLAFLFSIYP